MDPAQLAEHEKQLEAKGYTLQDAYKHIGGMGKEHYYIIIFRKISLFFKRYAYYGFPLRFILGLTDAVC
jgi:hypothetical protein